MAGGSSSITFARSRCRYLKDFDGYVLFEDNVVFGCLVCGMFLEGMESGKGIGIGGGVWLV